MPRILTRRKEKWIKQRKPQVIRGRRLANPAVIEERYAQKLIELVRRMTDSVDKRIERFFLEPHSEQYFDSAEDASVASQARILTNALMKKFNAQFAKLAPDIAWQQTEAVNKQSSATVHASMEQLSGGLSLPTSGITADMREILNASVTEQVSLIRSISMEYLAGVQGAVMRSITTGRGLADLVPYLEKHKGITHRRARNIALDQTRKAYNNLNRGRMEKLGLKKFEWIHSGGGEKPRPLHVSYNGRIFSFDDPPIIVEETGERGIPGQAINCKCTMVPVIDFGDDN